MSDHDRGAYTPQPDAPLQFDARGPRARRPMPMTLIGSGAVLVVLLGALALHYQHDTTAEPPRPVGEPLAQVKAAAPADAQPKDAAAGVDVFNGKAASAAATKAPTFAPPPEPPKPRPQLQVQALETIPTTRPATALLTTGSTATASTATGSTAGLPKAAPPPTAAAPGAAKPANGYKAPTLASIRPDATSVVDKVAGEPVPTKVLGNVGGKVGGTVAGKVEAKAAPVPTALAVAKTTATPVAAGGGAVVQIGAFSSTAQSDKGWSDVSSAMSGQMAGKAKRVEVLERDGKTLYRTSVVGFSSRAAADAFCKALAVKGKTCFVKS